MLRKWILEEPLDYPPGEKGVYSDLGFMLLELIVELQTGSSLKDYAEDNFYRPLSLSRLFLHDSTSPDEIEKTNIAATEACPWRCA